MFTLEDHVTAKNEEPALLPRMTAGELDCFRRYLGKASHFLEFGCGGSTLLAAGAGLSKIWSVESDAAWIRKLKERKPISDAVKNGRLKFFCPKIGGIGAWGRPQDPNSRHLWPRYHSEVWAELDPKTVDLVLIDGRFRVACALQAALRVSAKCPILIHDFWIRPKYHVATEFLTEVERVDTLGVFHPKEPRDVSGMIDRLFATMSRYDL